MVNVLIMCYLIVLPFRVRVLYCLDVSEKRCSRSAKNWRQSLGSVTISRMDTVMTSSDDEVRPKFRWIQRMMIPKMLFIFGTCTVNDDGWLSTVLHRRSGTDIHTHCFFLQQRNFTRCSAAASFDDICYIQTWISQLQGLAYMLFFMSEVLKFFSANGMFLFIVFNEQCNLLDKL